MKLLNTIMHVIKGVSNDAVESLVDIERDGRQVVRDLQARIDQVEKSAVNVLAKKKELEGKNVQLRQDITVLERIADKAIEKVASQGSTLSEAEIAECQEDARSQLAKAEVKQRQFESNARLLVGLTATYETALAHLEDFKNERDSIESELSIMATEYEVAKLQTSLVGSVGPGIDIGTLRKRVNAAKNKAAATYEFKRDTTDNVQELEKKYVTGSTSVSVEDKMKALAEKHKVTIQ